MRRVKKKEGITADGGLAFKMTEDDNEVAIRCITAFSNLHGLRPSQIGSPITWAILRTTPDGFPLVSPEEIVIVRTPVADTLRSIYVRFRSGESTPEQFSGAAMPILLQLYSEWRKIDADETQALIEEQDGQEPN